MADLNGDGKADLIVGGDFKPQAGGTMTGLVVGLSGGSSVMQDNFYGLDNDPADLTVVDLNRDKKPDIAAISDANSNNHTYLLTNNGDGTFQGVRAFGLALSQPSFLVVADLNQDSYLDTIAGSTVGSTVYVSFGNGTGNLQGGTTIALPKPPSGGTAGDVNGDGHPDPIFAFSTAMPVRVLLNTP